MALDRSLAAAYIDNNVRHRVLGRRLYPFSIWHKFLLEAVGSPFLYGGDVRFFDLREVAGVCSMRYPQCKVHRPWIIPIIAYWWFGWPRTRWMRYLVRTKNRLLEYFGDYISKPEYGLWYPETGPRNDGAPPPRLGPVPEPFVLFADIVSFLYCSEKDAWNMPVCKAYWYQLGYLRYKGEQIDFMDEEERQFQEQMRIAEEEGAKLNASNNAVS